jgi:hypothetical protein
MDDCGAVVSGADVADVGLAKLVCPEAAEECGEDEREIPFSLIGLAP